MEYSSTCGGEVEEPEKTADILSSGVTISVDEDEILQCDHLNETFYAVLSHGFFIIIIVTEWRERFNAANGRRPKSSGTTTSILWMQGVGLNECLIQKKNENLITNKTNDKTK